MVAVYWLTRVRRLIRDCDPFASGQLGPRRADTCPSDPHQDPHQPDPMMENLFVILVLLLVGWLWLDMLRAREMAVAMAKRACERHDVQFLDQAVALRRLGLRWTNDGLRLRRQYRFEFSEEG